MKLPIELLESLMADLTLLAATANCDNLNQWAEENPNTTELFPEDFKKGCDEYVKKTVQTLLAEWTECKSEDWEVI